jgi:[histone H3]-lysine4 N-trimethyltransferase SETD1
MAGKSRRGNRQELRKLRQELQEVTRGSETMTLGLLTQRKKALMFGKSRIHGMGLYACEDIPPGDFIIEYNGEVIRRAVADVREKTYVRQGMGDSYLFRLTADLVVDATRKGSIARFINHSCDPSVFAKIITVSGEAKIVFYSKRAVRSGEELTYDYKFAFEEEDSKVACYCGAAICRKYLN